MIPVNNPDLFVEALGALKAFGKEEPGFKGRFIQIFLGLKFFQNDLPSIHSGAFISTQDLQALLDDLFTKVSRPDDRCVLSLFKNNFLARTGITSAGKRSAQNTWRNNFNLQKGIGCYAPASDLEKRDFLDQPRTECPYLEGKVSTSLKGASCSLDPGNAAYRSEGHRKWLHIDPEGRGYAITDLEQSANFTPYVTPSGHRLPVIPLIVALYHDADPGLVLGHRAHVDTNMFLTDFNFSQRELALFFDASPQHPLNQRMLKSPHWPKRTSIDPQATVRRTADGGESETDPEILEPVGIPTPPPGINTGWEAEQFVAALLQENGWRVEIVTRRQLGYDLFAKKRQKSLYVEGKSSLGLCSPTLTEREWRQAERYGPNYILAILEHFNPETTNRVVWVSDPAEHCRATEQATISFRISRASWTGAETSLANL